MNEPPSVPEPPEVPVAPSPPRVPPTMPTAPVPQHEKSWPKVLGILCCIFGGLGLMGRVFQVVGIVAMNHLPIDDWMKPPAHLSDWLLVLTIAGFSISILHVVLGVQLLRRRPSVKWLSIAFLVVVVALYVPGAFLQYEVQQAQTQAMQQHFAQQSQSGGGPPPSAASIQLGSSLGVAFGILGGVIAIAWPVFLIIWLFWPSNGKIVQSWKSA